MRDKTVTRIKEKIDAEIRQLNWCDTKSWEEDENCGNCTGDSQYNKNYRSGGVRFENFVYIDNSCQTILYEDEEIVEVGGMNEKEAIALIKRVKEAVATALTAQEQAEKELDAEL